jgi:hypothetical protein
MDQAPNPLAEWMESLMPKPYRTKRAVADAAGLTSSAFWRQVQNGTLGIEPLLRLARATGTPASRVLTLAGKGELADLIESLFGTARPDRRADVEQVADALQHWSPEYVAALHTMVATPPPRTQGTADMPPVTAPGTTPPARSTRSSPHAPSEFPRSRDTPATRRTRRPK